MPSIKQGNHPQSAFVCLFGEACQAKTCTNPRWGWPPLLNRGHRHRFYFSPCTNVDHAFTATNFTTVVELFWTTIILRFSTFCYSNYHQLFAPEKYRKVFGTLIYIKHHGREGANSCKPVLCYLVCCNLTPWKKWASPAKNSGVSWFVFTCYELEIALQSEIYNGSVVATGKINWLISVGYVVRATFE